MTDEELIKQLRETKITQDLRYTLEDTAADRIEQLVATNKQLVEEIQDTEDRANAFATKEYHTEMRAKRAETKLAKAVEALRFTDDGANHGAMTSTYGESALRYILRGIRERARAVLDELEKTK